MEGWTDFILARYNYWIVILLMMLGLYTVVARGNLVKKIVGLNIFQTSVFIFYITMSKVAGGTAPIYVPDYGASDYGDGHGKDGYGDGAQHDGPQHDGVLDGQGAGLANGDKIANPGAANDLKTALAQTPRPSSTSAVEGLHEAPAGSERAANSTFVADAKAAAAQPGFDIVESAADGAKGAGDAVYGAGDALASVVYSNPLPHVLILTAIVVGVSGTAVGLALAVRIREAYGTIEEDELEAIDNVAEFGAAAPSVEATGLEARS